MECLGSSQKSSRADKAWLVLELRQDHDLAVLLRVAGLSRSTFYYQAKVQQMGDSTAELKSRIKAIYDHHKGRYGYRRITDELRKAGTMANHKLVQRLMLLLGLKSLVRPKKYQSYRGPQHTQVADNLQRRFYAARPNQKWVTDVTEFKVRGTKLYLSPVMDLYNGEIVAYDMQRSPRYTLVGNMLKKSVHDIGRWPDTVAPFGSRLAVSDACVSAGIGRTRFDAKHVTQRQLFGQCSDGKLLWHAQVGVLLSERVRQRGAATDGPD